MFCISIPIENTQLVWTLLYDSEDAANAAWSKMTDAGTETAIVSDDYGQVARIDRAHVAVALFENLEKSKQGHVQRALHNARTQASADQMAVNDPVLKAARMMQGPAVFNPVNGGMSGRHG